MFLKSSFSLSYFKNISAKEWLSSSGIEDLFLAVFSLNSLNSFRFID